MYEIEITHLWFHTELSLVAIAEQLDLRDRFEDAENHWMWLEGTWGSERLNLGRTHVRPPGEVETVLHLRHSPGEPRREINGLELVELAEELLTLGISPVCFGRRRHVRGERFDMIELGRFARG
ncbi:MAG: hypothetical protein R3B82_29695 [Sandaracinaceae bacterium]